MAFSKGNKHGKGRPVGSKNVKSEAIRAVLDGLLLDELTNVKDTLTKVRESNPVAYLNVVLKVCDIVLPKEVNANGNLTLDLEQILTMPALDLQAEILKIENDGKQHKQSDTSSTGTTTD